MKALFYASQIFTLFTIIYGALDPEKLESIDKVINDVYIPKNNLSGVSLAVVLDGEVVISKGFGKRDIEHALDVENNTLFSIGSITKSVIATLAVRTLHEKYPGFGEAVMDVPIAFLNPNINFTFADRYRAEQTSFRDLLSHRTCLASYDLDIQFGSVKTINEYTYRSRYETEVCKFRTGWQYNNALYALAGELVASIAGKSLEDLVRNFMTEIGMEYATTFDAKGSYEDLPNMSQCYYWRDNQHNKYNFKSLRRIHIALGAGGILASSSDMTKYMSFHLNKGKVGDTQVVPEEAMSWLYKPSIHLEALAGKQSESEDVSGTYAYGLGLHLSLYKGYSLISHGGYYPPYHSEMFLFPAKNLGIFVTSNGRAVSTDYSTSFVGGSIFNIIFEPSGGLGQNLKKSFHLPSYDSENIIGNLKKSASLRKSNFETIEKKRITKIEFKDVIGHYGDRVVGDLTITLDDEDNNFLQMNLGEWGIGRLRPVEGSETLFRIDWKTDILHQYYVFPQDIFPVPSFHIDFQLNSLYLKSDGITIVEFVKDATLDTFPVFPWDPTSCGPQNYI